MVKTYNSLKRYGYQPWRKGFIGGTFLNREDGEHRYIILQGNHRAAMLAHLGVKSILTAPVSGCSVQIDQQNVKEWEYVRTGRCSENDALVYFRAFFELTGYEQAERFGMV